jgi:hypothetical protein
MSRIYILSLLVLLVSRAFVSAEPKIELEGVRSLDFGSYPAQEERTATFRIKNTGTSELRILGIRKTCGCSSAKARQTVLKPEMSTEVDVRIAANSIYGLYSKNIFIESNDPSIRFLVLTVSGEAVPLIDVDPGYEVYVGRVPRNTSHKQVFQLRATQEVKLGEVLNTSSHPVDVRMSPGSGSSASEYQLAVTILPTDESGDFTCQLEIPVLSPTNHTPVKLDISARLGAQLNCVPGILYVPVSDVPVTRTFLCWVLGQRSRILRPDELSLQDTEGVSYTAKPARGGSALEVEVTLSPAFTRQLFVEERLPLTFSVTNASSGNVVCKIRKE